MYQPDQLDVVTLALGSLPLGLYGEKAFVARVGEPTTFEDLKRDGRIGYDRDDRLIRGLRAEGLTATRDDFYTRCDDQVTYWAPVAAGCGFGVTQQALGDPDRRVVRVLKDWPLSALPV